MEGRQTPIENHFQMQRWQKPTENLPMEGLTQKHFQMQGPTDEHQTQLQDKQVSSLNITEEKDF